MRITINPYKLTLKLLRKFPQTMKAAVLIETGVAAIGSLADIGRKRTKKIDDIARKGMLILIVLTPLCFTSCNGRLERGCWTPIIWADDKLDVITEFEIKYDSDEVIRNIETNGMTTVSAFHDGDLVDFIYVDESKDPPEIISSLIQYDI